MRERGSTWVGGVARCDPARAASRRRVLVMLIAIYAAVACVCSTPNILLDVSPADGEVGVPTDVRVSVFYEGQTWGVVTFGRADDGTRSPRRRADVRAAGRPHGWRGPS